MKLGARHAAVRSLGWIPIVLVLSALALAANFDSLKSTSRPTTGRPRPNMVPPERHEEDVRRRDVDTRALFQGRITEYPGTRWIPVSGDLVANGVPMRVAFAETRDIPRDVTAYYADEFRHQGLRPMVRDWGQGMRMVGAVDTERGEVLTVTAVDREDGTVEIRPAIGDIASGGFEFAAPADLPHVPGSGGFFSSTADEGSTRERTVQSVNWAPVEDTAAFYRRKLADDGWRREEETPSAGGQVLLRYRRDHTGKAEEIFVALQPLSDKAGTNVFIAQRTRGKP